jgi:hypothetical protein
MGSAVRGQKGFGAQPWLWAALFTVALVIIVLTRVFSVSHSKSQIIFWEKMASQTIGSNVKIAAIEVDRATGAWVLNNVTVAQPAGYGEGHIIEIKQLRLLQQYGAPAPAPTDASAKDNKGLVSDEIIDVAELNILGLVVNLKVDEAGSNLAALVRNFNKAASLNFVNQVPWSGYQAQDKVMVRRADIADAKIMPHVVIKESAVPLLTMSDIEMRALAVRQGGALASEIIVQILEHTLKSVSYAADQAGYYQGMAPEAYKAMQEQLGFSGAVLGRALDNFSRELEVIGENFQSLIRDVGGIDLSDPQVMEPMVIEPIESKDGKSPHPVPNAPPDLE